MESLVDGINPPSMREFVPVVVVPTFNHERALIGVLAKLLPLGLPLVVADDGSTDQTPSRLSEWRRTMSEAAVEIRTHSTNLGKAAALRTGFLVAEQLGASHVVTIDSDGQLEPSDIPKLLEIARRNPDALVLGERPLNMPGCPARCAAGRRFTSLAIRAECGVRLSDSQCGLRVYPMSVIRNVRCRAGRYSFEAEIITRAAWAGYPILSEPVACRYLAATERVSHFRPWIDSLRQAGVHGRLMLMAMAPLSRRRPTPRMIAEPLHVPPSWRRALHWMNPARCWRDCQPGDLGWWELAAAVAIGVWIGTTPLFGFHTLLCVYVAWRLHLHPVPMVLGSQISIPPVGIVLAVASTWIGHFILTGHRLSAAEIDDTWNSWPTVMWQLLPDWFVGSALLGLILAALAFWLTLLARCFRLKSD